MVEHIQIVNSVNQMARINTMHLALLNVKNRALFENMATFNFQKIVQMAIVGGVPSSIVSQIKFNQISLTGSEKVIQNEAQHPASAFFETGVRPHIVFDSYMSVNGYAVRQWLDKKGLMNVNSFMVGTKGALKRPGAQFMKKSYDQTMEAMPVMVGKYMMEAIK